MRFHKTDSTWLKTLVSFFSLFILVAFVAAQDCSKTNPCKTGCCSKFGFCGLGPDYCHKDVCVANCDRKADCDPGGYGAAFVNNTRCPLNVCCSRWGFCGLTKEFCGDKKIPTPKCDTNHRLRRVVGYYEGWAPTRPCNAIMPEQIPLGVYTHLNFAFATIDPHTFEIRPSNYMDRDLWRRLTNLKQADPDLKVLIAIGGWTFNDPGPTQRVFSDLARSEKNQKAFFRSLLSMMSTYDFDGVDLDWEYPVAPDRNGRGEDFKTFPQFLANLKRAMKGSGGRDTVSLTLPASYWYLQHFDIVKIEKHIDFFNIMSYDLHGVWDKHNKWVGPYLNAHTNLTEIEDAMNLLWRNQIDPDKVVLGMGFYGRSFTATNPNCRTPGCTYESGGPRQRCSGEVGVILNSEIDDIIKKTGSKPTFDKEAAVKMLTFGNNDWVAYDDKDTFKLKADFARKQCMSGIMVWAVSHDTPDGKYSEGVAAAAGRKFTSLSSVIRLAQVGTTLKENEAPPEKKIDQCKWTNCGESCPSGWVRVLRNDREKRKDEYMVDGTGCPDKNRPHELCCPTEAANTVCGWYQHNNGKCSSTCPAGTVEIGSLKLNCRKGYQAACCTTGFKSLKLYEQCAWGQQYPLFCDSNTCSNEEVARSPTGSGGHECTIRKWDEWEDNYEIQERPYCCDNGNAMQKWDDCQWYDNLGPGRDDDEHFCRSGCPGDRVRVAMDRYWNEPGGAYKCFDGARSKCCIPKFSVIAKRESSKDEVFEDTLNEFVKRPICDADGFFERRGLILGAHVTPDPHKSNRGLFSHSGHATAHIARHQRDLHGRSHTSQEHALELRAEPSSFAKHEITAYMLILLQKKASTNQVRIWNDVVAKVFKNLTWKKLNDYLEKSGELVHMGVFQLAELIPCNLATYNNKVGGNTKGECGCDTQYCCPGGGNYCAVEHEELFLGKRELMSATESSRELLDKYDEAYDDLFPRAVPGEPRPYSMNLPGGGIITFTSAAYTPATDYPHGHPIYDHVFHFVNVENEDDDNCVEVQPQVLQRARGVAGMHAEHLVEMNTMPRFFNDAVRGRLTSGATMRAGPISASFFVQGLRTPLVNPPPMAGGQNSNIPIDRIMNALGSVTNDRNFVLTVAGLNWSKGALWAFRLNFDTFHWSDARMDEALDDPNTWENYVTAMREVIVSINYIRHPWVWQRLVNIFFNVRDELARAQDAHYLSTGIRDNVTGAWDEWFKDFLREVLVRAQRRVREWTMQARNRMAGRNEEEVYIFLARVNTLYRLSQDLEFDLNSLP